MMLCHVLTLMSHNYYAISVYLNASDCLLKDWCSSDAIVPELTVYIEGIFMDIIIIEICIFGALDISMTFNLIISK